MYSEYRNDTLSESNSILNPYDGYLKGNVFKNIYNQYKNYVPVKLIPNSEQEELLLNVNQLCFIMHELNLYLDVFPNDSKMIELFNKYEMMANEATIKYEKNYGPLTINSVISEPNNFTWENTLWPWEVK